MHRQVEAQLIDGSRWYVDLNSGVRAPSVTSIQNMLSKPFLQKWYAKQSAELAVRSISSLAAMVEEDPTGTVEYLSGAARRYTRKRGDVGSRAHDVFERQLRGLPAEPDADIGIYARHFGEFLDVVQPELISAEDIAWSSTHNYAGSYDAILRIKVDERGYPDPQGEPRTVVADWKTSKSVYPEVALQMAAYRHAEERIAADGTAGQMTQTDGAYVLHVTPERWRFRPVDTEFDVFAVFLSLRGAFDWHQIQKGVVQRAVAEGGGFETGTERRT